MRKTLDCPSVRNSNLKEAELAVNIPGAYAHYLWCAFLAKTKKTFNDLEDNDT